MSLTDSRSSSTGRQGAVLAMPASLAAEDDARWGPWGSDAVLQLWTTPFIGGTP